MDTSFVLLLGFMLMAPAIKHGIEVQLPETRLAIFVRRTDALDGIEVKVRVGKRTLAEGFGRTVIGLGSLL